VVRLRQKKRKKGTDSSVRCTEGFENWGIIGWGQSRSVPLLLADDCGVAAVDLLGGDGDAVLFEDAAKFFGGEARGVVFNKEFVAGVG
jgi:hypothetical protein